MARAAALRGFFHQIFDFVLEDEEVRSIRAGQADEGMIVIFNRTGDFLSVDQPHPNGDPGLDQVLEVPYFFKGLLGSAIAGFTTTVFGRNWLSCLTPGTTDTLERGEPELSSASP